MAVGPRKVSIGCTVNCLARDCRRDEPSDAIRGVDYSRIQRNLGGNRDHHPQLALRCLPCSVGVGSRDHQLPRSGILAKEASCGLARQCADCPTKQDHRDPLRTGTRVSALPASPDEAFPEKRPARTWHWTGPILAAMLVLLAACTEQQITTEPASPEGSGTTGEQQHAAVGDTITLHGTDSGLMMDVTLMEVIDPAKAGRFFGPGKNERLVAVRLRVENVGTLPFSDSPSNGAVLIDTADQGYNASILDSAAGPALGSPKIAPGDARVGLITFECRREP